MVKSKNPFFSRHTLCLILFLIPGLLELDKAIGAEAEDTRALVDKRSQWGTLQQSIEKSTAREQANIAQIKTRLAQAESLKKKVEADLEACKLQYTTSGNLLLLPDSQPRELEKSRTECDASLTLIAGHLKNITALSSETAEALRQVQENYDLAEKQLAEIRGQEAKDSETRSVLDHFRSFLTILSEKRTLLTELAELYHDQVRQLKENMTALTELSDRFEEQIKQRKKEALFRRNLYPLILPGWGDVRQELARLVGQTGRLTHPEFWDEQLQTLWRSGIHFVITGFIFLLVVFLLLRRLHQFCIMVVQRPSNQPYPWRCLAMQLFQRSLPLLGTALFIYIYAHVQHLYSAVPVLRLMVWLLAIALCTRWVLDFLKFWPQAERPAIPEPISNRLRVLTKLVRYFAGVYVILAWLMESTGFLLPAARLVFELSLLFWAVSFRKEMKTQVLSVSADRPLRMPNPSSLFLGLVYLVVGGALVVELAGFGSLALYWLVSWGRCAIVLLWGGLLFLVIHEWDRQPNPVSDPAHVSPEKTSRPYRWMLSRLLWLVWLAALVVSLLLAWGAKQTVLVGVMRSLTYPFVVGQMRFSLMGLLFAVLVLFLTRLATRLWRHILQEKILVDSGMESGVQNSITSITVYALWVLGILISLHAFGLNTTTLAVGFGAVGIGLGFGLQNIFNNFISGIILLFERPIQVGDAVEINGVWAEVKKINVRSTVVQTYDNASLIIPNSEFISNQVTNWSFKDLSLRRGITVGVAYGSDIELTRQTLLEIAAKTEKVYKYPKPDVLFTDFGDSALIFKLRVWTDIDSMLNVETAIRFEIDRLFRERGLEIAFPQRDIHIRSMVGGAVFGSASSDNSARASQADPDC